MFFHQNGKEMNENKRGFTTKEMHGFSFELNHLNLYKYLF
jgi:hypothetical protein